MPNQTDPKIFQNITKPIKYRASYEKRDFTVTWKNWDSSTLKTETVGMYMSATPPSNPTRAGYTFSGWDVTYTTIASNLTITAMYEAMIYTVKWMNWDGNLLKEEKVEHGKSATQPNEPSRVNYVFKGWSVAYTSVTSDLTITAQYELVTYTVKWLNWDSLTLKEEKVQYSKSATPPSDPSRFGYNFTGWDIAYASITSDLVITANFKRATYIVKWLNWDSSLLKEEVVEHGSSATQPDAPIRVGHTFTGWNALYSDIQSNLTITAKFEKITYAVKWLDWDGSTLKEENVKYGESATPPSSPSREGYTFAEWDVAYSDTQSNLTITAKYKIAVYTVRWLNWDGGLLKEESVEHGKSATQPSNPTKLGYSFTGWDGAFSNITSNTVIKAVFNDYESISEIKTYNYNSFAPWYLTGGSTSLTSYPFIGQDLVNGKSGIVIFASQRLSKASFDKSIPDVPINELIDAARLTITTTDAGITYRAATIDDFKMLLGDEAFYEYELVVNQLIGKAIRIVNNNTYGDSTMTISCDDIYSVLGIYARLKSIVASPSLWKATEAKISVSVLEGTETGTQYRKITTLSELDEYAINTSYQVKDIDTEMAYPHFLITKSSSATGKYKISSKIANKYESMENGYYWQ